MPLQLMIMRKIMNHKPVLCSNCFLCHCHHYDARRHTPSQSHWCARCCVITTLLLLFCVPQLATARNIEPKVGDPAPIIAGRSIDDQKVDSSTLTGKVIIIQFVGTDHQRSMEEVTRLAELLRDPSIAAVKPEWLMILSKKSNPADINDLKPDDKKPTIIHDTNRELFERYGIVVLPTVVIVDERGIVAYFLPGPSLQFEPDIRAALLFAAGQITREQFEETLHPGSGTDKRTREKAEHLAHLAQRMIEQDMADAAVDLLEQAVNTDPKCFTARLGLGEVYLRKGRFGEAATQFEKALAQNKLSIDASLGLAAALIAVKPQVEAGAEVPLKRAETILDEIIQRNPSNARAHYLNGLVLERNGKIDSARIQYRKSVELLLEQNGIWHQ